MNMERQQDTEVMTPADTGALAPSVAPSPLVPVPERARGLLLRMFADPYVLEQTERSELLGQLRESVGAASDGGAPRRREAGPGQLHRSSQDG